MTPDTLTALTPVPEPRVWECPTCGALHASKWLAHECHDVSAERALGAVA